MEIGQGAWPRFARIEFRGRGMEIGRGAASLRSDLLKGKEISQGD